MRLESKEAKSDIHICIHSPLPSRIFIWWPLLIIHKKLKDVICIEGYGSYKEVFGSRGAYQITDPLGNKLSNGLSSLKLSLNTSKCQVSSYPGKDLQLFYFPLSKCLPTDILEFWFNSSDLSWSNHIKDITSNARKQIGLLLYRRSLQACFTGNSVVILHGIALIRSRVEYTVLVWDPHLHKDIDTLESIQRFATKVCTESWKANYLYEKNLS